MLEFLVPAAIGVLCIVLGISHTKGNTSSLHSYHRKRVSEEDRIPFGKKVGLGTILVGCAILAYSALSAAAVATENQFFVWIGTAIMILGLVIGLGITFYAMIKYNKGIF